MELVLTSDLHGYLPEIPDCDVLMIGGDVCPVWNHDRKFQAKWLRNEFWTWLEGVPAKEIVIIGGNHDFALQDSMKFKNELPCHLLYDESITIEGLKIFGSPMSVSFGNWAFMKSDSALTEVWDKIPEDVDILMVHGPAFGILDMTARGVAVGSMTLRNVLTYRDFPKLKFLITGHIHEAHGVRHIELGDNSFQAINPTHVNLAYEPVHLPVTVLLA